MSKKAEYSYDYTNVSPSYLAGTRTYFREMKYLPKVIYKNASRYSNLRTIQDDITKKIHHESWNQQAINISEEDQYFTVTKREEGRLDIISSMYYGTPRFWWVIALANYLIDPFDVPYGVTLRIPPKQSLFLTGGVLSG